MSTFALLAGYMNRWEFTVHDASIFKYCFGYSGRVDLIITGFALGVIEGLTKYFYPEASNTVVFVLMVLVLLVKPTGLTGRAA